jgi:hypothetical protein
MIPFNESKKIVPVTFYIPFGLERHCPFFKKTSRFPARTICLAATIFLPCLCKRNDHSRLNERLWFSYFFNIRSNGQGLDNFSCAGFHWLDIFQMKNYQQRINLK